MKLMVTTMALLAMLQGLPGQAFGQAASAPQDLSGTWNLDRARSQFPRDIGFGMDVVPKGGRADEVDLEGRSGNPRSLTERPLSEQDARNARQILQEVRTPPAQLVITQSSAAVSVADERGRTRTFHTDGRTDWQALDAGPMASSARWETGRLVVRYRVEQGREVRYSYGVTADGALEVLTELVERGGRDAVTRVYRRVPQGTAPPAETPPPALPSERTAAPGAGAPVTSTPAGLVPAAAPQAAAPPAPLDTRPGAEFIGLKNAGLVTEGFGPEAAHCGIREPAVGAAVVQKLSESGFAVARNRDEDSYVYVHLQTTAMTTGFCFSRYDVSLYTNVAVTLPHGTKLVMVEVQLWRKGGLAGGGAGAHGEAVTRGITQLAAELATRVSQVNRQ